MADDSEVSPTGKPILPVALVPVLSALGAVAFAVESLTPSYTVAGKIAHGLVGLLSLAGLLSPGLRTKP